MLPLPQRGARLPRTIALTAIAAAAVAAASPASATDSTWPASAARERSASSNLAARAASLRAAPRRTGSAAARPAPRPRVLLPGDAAAASIKADQRTWLIGARPGAAAKQVARQHGARSLGPAASGGYVVARERARALAGALRAKGLLISAEPNGLSRAKQLPPAIPPDPLSPQAAWRDFVVDPTLTPPPVTPQSPQVALIDSAADLAHGEWAGGNGSSTGGQPITDLHGTATAAVVGAPKNDVGILGIWPGARTRNYPLPAQIRCSDIVTQIGQAIQEGAAVINMSFGSTSLCFQQFVALQFATARGVVLVAAAGNEFGEGNPMEFPASLPHVLTVAAITPQRTSAYFSNTNAAMDLGAPGVGILTAVPAIFDTDGTADGYQALDGTSFSAPMVSAAVAWVKAARPDLTADQLFQVTRLSAQDIDQPGWDPSTGFGVLSVSGALGRQAPPQDPTEPNDDIVWVDGTAFEKPDVAIWRGSGVRRFTALLDRFEDPADVYRITVPARRRARVTVKPHFGDPQLTILRSGADTFTQRSRRVATSRRGGQATERVTFRNRSRRKRTYYVAVNTNERGAALDAAYDLTVRR